jgi:hypothetical protein
MYSSISPERESGMREKLPSKMSSASQPNATMNVHRTKKKKSEKNKIQPELSLPAVEGRGQC